MDAFSSNCKSYAGRWLAHNKLSLPARAYAAADLVNGVCQLVNPTQSQASILARVNPTYTYWALLRPEVRDLVCAGVEPLVPPPIKPRFRLLPSPSTVVVETTGPLLNDAELLAIARANGTERVFSALEALL